jgi:hypothetical protein
MISTTIDPDGRRVVLTRDRWGHIKEEHPILATRLRDIMATVREPTRRTRGRAADEEWFWSDEPFERLWLQVVVHYEGGEGWIATAFPRRLPRSPGR